MLKYLGGPLLDGLNYETWYDGGTTPDNNIGYIFYQNKVIFTFKNKLAFLKSNFKTILIRRFSAILA